jgi:hypothetical protein
VKSMFCRRPSSSGGEWVATHSREKPKVESATNNAITLLIYVSNAIINTD